jgi:heparanase
MRMKLIAGCAIMLVATAATGKPSNGLGLSTLTKLGTVDERFQAYNIEMVEVTGGRFWAPYGGLAGERYRQRPPIDLSNPKLIALAKHLGPSLMRVSGTWANNTYLEAEGEKLTAPPKGFMQVLMREQWRGVVAFSKAVDAPIVTSFAVSNGTRGPDGVWKTEQAQRLVDLTKDAGGNIYAAEFFNETNVPSAAPEMPKNYAAANYTAEFRIFKDWARKTVPDMKILGPGGVGEGGLLTKIPVPGMGFIPTEDLTKDNPNSVDAFSYHYYGTVSQRCEAMGIGTAKKEEALTGKWLDLTLRDYDLYAKIRDKYEPGKPIWNTETAQAACGGSPWASSFLDSFRYLNQNGLLAQKGVAVVMHNTLAASDYALIDQDTLAPRPSYWAAVLWKRVMGRTVLASPKSPSAYVRIYAHCLVGQKGGVGLTVLNLGTAQQSLAVGRNAQSWVMTGQPVDTKTVLINGKAPSLTDKGALAGLDGAPVKGNLSVPGQSIAFVGVKDAGNKACS